MAYQNRHCGCPGSMFLQAIAFKQPQTDSTLLVSQLLQQMDPSHTLLSDSTNSQHFLSPFQKLKHLQLHKQALRHSRDTEPHPQKEVQEHHPQSQYRKEPSPESPRRSEGVRSRSRDQRSKRRREGKAKNSSSQIEVKPDRELREETQGEQTKGDKREWWASREIVYEGWEGADLPAYSVLARELVEELVELALTQSRAPLADCNDADTDLAAQLLRMASLPTPGSQQADYVLYPVFVSDKDGPNLSIQSPLYPYTSNPTHYFYSQPQDRLQVPSQIFSGQSQSKRQDDARLGLSPRKPVSDRERYFKTKLCYDYLNGKCRRGAGECAYAHGDQDLRKANRPKSLCRNYQRGFCTKTEKECRFSHSRVEEADKSERSERIVLNSLIEQKDGKQQGTHFLPATELQKQQTARQSPSSIHSMQAMTGNYGYYPFIMPAGFCFGQPSEGMAGFGGNSALMGYPPYPFQLCYPPYAPPFQQAHYSGLPNLHLPIQSEQESHLHSLAFQSRNRELRSLRSSHESSEDWTERRQGRE